MQIHLDDLVSFLAVGLLDRIFDSSDRFLARQHTGDSEKTGLHDRIDAAAHSSFMGDLVSIDNEEAWPSRYELLLHGFRQIIPNLVGTEWRVQQESSIRCYLVDYIVALEKT